MSQEPIFKQSTEKVTLTSSPLSFKECPNRCVDGYYIDPYHHRRVKCSYCEEKRKELAKNEIKLNGDDDIKRFLNISSLLHGYGSFEFDTIIPKSVSKSLTPESMEMVKKSLEELFNSASIGVASDKSLLYNLGLNAHPCNFIYPYLMRCYIGGLTVSPYITARDVYLLLRRETDNSIYKVLDLGESIDLVYNDLLKTDVCVVHINSGSSFEHINSVKGLMQMRAHNNKATIIFTDAWWFGSNISTEVYIKRSISSLYSEERDGKDVAELVKVTYIKKSDTVDEKQKEESKQSKNTIGKNLYGMSQEDFKNLMSPKQNL